MVHVAMQALVASSGAANTIDAGDVFWRNTTIADSAGTALVANPSGQLTFTNNLLWGGTVGVIGGAGDTAGGYNLFWELDTDSQDASVEASSVLEDPELTAFVSGSCDVEGLRPADGSPAIDAGDPGILDTDGSRSDIGAFGGGASVGEPGEGGDDTDASDTEVQSDTEDVSNIDEIDLYGGCRCAGSSDSGAAFLLLLPLGWLTRRRRQAA